MEQTNQNQENKVEDKRTAEEIIAELNLNEEDFPHLSRWGAQHLLETLQGIAKASGGTLESAAVNLELDLSMI